MGTQLQLRKVKNSEDGKMVRVDNNVNVVSITELYT